jgi:coenzyme Q-binding protein COQ10
MIEHRETRFVPFPAELMYRVVADVERYPDFLPWVVALRVLSRAGNAISAEMAVGYGALRERYISDIRLDPEARRVDVTQTSGPFRVLENHWRFTPEGGGCLVDFAIRFEFKNRLLHAVASAKFEKALLKMTDAFEARARTLTGH